MGLYSLAFLSYDLHKKEKARKGLSLSVGLGRLPCEVGTLLNDSLIVHVIGRAVSLMVFACANHQSAEVKLELLTRSLGLSKLILQLITEECESAIRALDAVLQALRCIHLCRLCITVNCCESTQSYRCKILIAVVLCHKF